MNTTATRNYPLIFIRTVVWALMLLAAYVSASHIMHTSEMLGLSGWYVYTTPLFIDLIAVAGKLSMMARFNEYPAFQRSGKWMLMLGGVLSLSANIAAGSNWGERGYGILVVGGFMLLENHATKAAGKATVEQVDPAEAARQQAIAEAEAQQAAEEAAEAARRSESAKKAAATRKENAEREAKEKADRLEARRQRAALRKLEELAPTSPGHPATILSAADKAVLAEHMAR